jgi:hypothetical protein
LTVYERGSDGLELARFGDTGIIDGADAGVTREPGHRDG